MLSYHLGLLSSLIRVTVGGPTSSFVRGHIASSFGTGPPPGGDPSVHHGVTRSEERPELELFPFFLLLPFLPSPLTKTVRPQASSCKSDMVRKEPQEMDLDVLVERCLRLFENR